MDNHRAEEDKEGKKWAQWQAMQLKSLEKFKKDNRKKYDFSKINMVIDDLIQEAYDKGGMEEEVKILKQIKKLHGNSVTNAVKSKISDIKQRLTPGVNQEFFGLNREKVDKLIKATHSDMEKVEQAMLRKADDQYRKIIFNAQMADISGAFTYEQAVDMAAKDFLNAGLNCVEYKNGRKVTAKTYAEMAIRTANARATLMAAGDKRQQLGITTVIVGHNGSACPLCQKWLGKVLIDDVYSGGKPTDGEYPLLSTAMKEGLFHPNCRDVIGTYIPGITRLPEPPKPEERQLSFDVYNLEQKEKQAKHNAERMGRLGDNSLDPSNKKKYKHREKIWKEKVEEYEKDIEKIIPTIASKESQYKEYLKGLKDGVITLRKRQNELLQAIPNKGDWCEFRNKQVDINDLAALTAKTGDEFALFVGKNNKIVIHGGQKWSIPKDAWEIIQEEKYEWKAHSHPTYSTKIMSSREDRETLKLFTWQEFSSIIDLEGNVENFTASEQDWFNSVLGVRP